VLSDRMFGGLLLDEVDGRPRCWRSWYSLYGLRKMSAVDLTMSVPVPMAADVAPVTGSQRRFSIMMGFGSYLNKSVLIRVRAHENGRSIDVQL
jgi:hypothetical protein